MGSIAKRVPLIAETAAAASARPLDRASDGPAPMAIPATPAGKGANGRRPRALPVRSSPVSTERSLRTSLETLHAQVSPGKKTPARAKPAPFVRKPVLQELEARLLLSADLSPAAQDTLLATPSMQGAEFRALTEVSVPTVVTSAHVAPIQRTHELVFVDTQTPEYQALVEAMRESALAQGRNLEFVLIDADHDGIRKITDTLAQKSDLDAIHIISHATDGSVQLGSAQLDFDTLLKRAASVKKWGEALTEQGDILFYGCDLAATEQGQSLMQAVARLTRADVAASEDPTGAASKGGDWELEFTTGAVQTPVVVSVAGQNEWLGLLAPGITVNAAPGLQTSEAGGTASFTVVLDEAPSAAVTIALSSSDTTEGKVSSGSLTFTTANWNVAQTVTVTGVDDSQPDGNVGYSAVTGAATSADAGYNGLNAADVAVTNFDNDRVTAGVVALYLFDETSGQVLDTSNFDASPVNLTISDPGAVSVVRANGVLTISGADTNTILSSGANDLAAALNPTGTASDDITLEAWVQPANTTNFGPARLVSMSADTSNRNFQLAQGGSAANDGDKWNARLRTTTTDANGNPEINTADGSADTSLQHVVFTHDAAGNEVLYVNGVTVYTGTRTGDFGNWNAAYVLNLANEIGGSRQFLGDMHLVAIYNTALSAAEVQRNYSAGADAHKLVVDTTADYSNADANWGDTSSIGALLQNRGADDLITLREAITAANNTANGATPDRILFNIPGAGPHTITVLDGPDGGSFPDALPTITDAVIIDGWSEPDFAGSPIIELVADAGQNNGNEIDGLVITAGNSTIRGLVINGFGRNDGDATGAGIVLNGGSGNTIVGNWIGLDTDGTTDAGNAFGILVIDSANNVIGGASSAERNVIGGNDDEGIRIDGDASDGNVIIGNYIGTDVTGTLNLGASSDGILIWNSADNNRVGGTAPGEGNLVAFNDWGVSIADDDTDGNAILGNTIRSNVQMGIELDPVAGNDTNDANDTDTTRPNLGQNFPVLTSAITNGSTVRIAGTLDGTVSSFFRIEFFANPTNDPEGERYLGYVNVATPAGGADATFDVMFTAAVAVNEYVTATATRATDGTYTTFRDTSEFSVTRQVLAAGGQTVSGIVYEDVDADGVVTDPGTQRLAGVTVDLWADLLGTPTYIASVTTDANGAYSFIGLGNLVYGAAIRSTTITPTAGFNAGFDVGDVWADQTYAGRDGVYWNGATYAYLASAGALFGGLESPSGGTSDSGSPTNVLGYEHIIRTDLTGGVNRLDADFGFSFSTVTNARGDAGDDDAAADRVQQGSLRQFALNSNAIAGVQAADFSIGGGGLQTITLAAGAPIAALSDAVVLDGTTQEGVGATPRIELNGASAGAGASGFVLAAGSSGSRIEGFAINRFNWFGVLINGSSNNVVSGNFLGTDPSGTAAGANNSGVVIWGNSTGNTIGGTTAADRNVISGNAVDGVQFQGAGVQNNVVIGNYIGLDRNGTADLGNTNQGVAIFNGASINTIGGTAPGAGNVISGNNGEGVLLQSVGTTGNQILGNYIGTNAAGTAAIGNGTGGGNGDGVQIDQGATNNVIGGGSGAGNLIGGNTGSGVYILDNSDNNTIRGNWIGTDQTGTTDLGNTLHGVRVAGGGAAGSSPTTTIVGGILAGEANTIAFNGGDGVEVTGAAQAVAISGNSIYSNDGLGIDLAGNGVTANDAGDGDGATGPNTLQNYPNLVQARVSGASLYLSGNMDTAAGSYRLHVYANTTADATGFGEGERYIGYIDIVHPGGNYSFNNQLVNLVAGAPAIGERITVTAMQLSGPDRNTSEFSAAVLAVDAATETWQASAAPVIDGVVDTIWSAATIETLGYVSLGTVSGPADLSASYRTLWDATGLYLLVEVTDDVRKVPDGGPEGPWGDDIIEVFIDANYSRSTPYDGADYYDEVDDLQLGFRWSPTTPDFHYGINSTALTGAIAWTMVPTASGYRLETALPWTSLGLAGAPVGGSSIGVEIQVGDDDDVASGRDGKLAWADPVDVAWINAGAFGTSVLRVNDAPIASDDSYTVAEDTTLTVDWWDTDWTRRSQITFNNTDVGGFAPAETLTDFPVLVVLNASNINYAFTQDDGGDLRFFDTDGTSLAYEIDLWDETGNSYVWVKVPQIDIGAADSVLMYYGNAGAADGQNASAVWAGAGYRSVYHLGDAGATIQDATATNYDGTPTNGASSAQPGQIGLAYGFDGSNDYIDLGANRSFIDGATAATFSAWVNPDDVTNPNIILSASIASGAPSGTSRMAIELDPGGEIKFIVRSGDGIDTTVFTTTAVTAGVWHYVTGVVNLDTDQVTVYVDGTARALTGTINLPASAFPNTPSASSSIGAGDDGAAPYFDGRIDEARVATVARTAGWIQAEYRAMLNQVATQFVSVGSAQFAPALGGVLNNDSDTENAPLSVALVSDVSNGILTLNPNGTFVYTPNANFFGTDTFTYVANDGTLDSNIATVTITVTPVNDPPAILGDLAFTVSEGGSYVLTLADLDESDPDDALAGLTYTITGGLANGFLELTTAAGTPIASFTQTQLAAGQVRYVHNGSETLADSITVSLADGGEDGAMPATAAIAVTVTPVNDNTPVITSAATANVAENSTAVTTVTATDADLPAQVLTYSIVGGADAARFSIVAGTGVLSFNAAPDFEAPLDVGADNVYDVTVQVDDNAGRTTTQAIAVTVTPVNDNTPVITSAATANVAENSTAVTTVTATDADLPAQVLTYSIVGGADAARFSIVAGTGVLSFNAAPDFEAPLDVGADNVYDVTVQVDDNAGRTTTQAIAVTVTPVNDNTPVITSAATANVAENSTAVTTVTATDADLPAQVLTYSIVGGADAARFSIVAGTGVLSFNAAPDFEAPLDVGADNVYDVTVQVDDNAGRTTTQAIAVTVTPVNDNTPVITSAATANVAENSTAVTTVTATDADLPAQVLTYSIVGGADAARFSIVAGTGVLSFNAAPDFEAPLDVGADNVYDVTVQVDDNAGRTTTQAIAVTVTPVNDNTPVITSAATANVAENSTAVTTVTATDADLPAQVLTYSIVGGADAARFSIVAGTGVLSFNAAPDFEAPLDVGADNVYDVTVQVDDNAGRTTTQAIAVTVTPVNDNTPVITSAATANVAENSTAVTTVTATDADLPAQVLTYSIVGGADAARFSIVAGTGVLSFNAAPDFEAPLDVGADNVYDVTVQVDDNAGRTTTQAIAVTVTPVNDNTPVITSAATANVAENSTAVTTVTATDADLPAQVLTYSIVGGADAARFSIVAGTGVLSFNAAPDFEAPLDVGADNVYDVTVQVDDNAGRTTTQAIAVTVTPVNDNTPVITSAATANVAENSTAVTTVTATDADLPAQVLTYSIVGGADAARFSIVAGTGVLSFNAAPDFEAPLDVGADNVYDVTVQVDDNAGRTTTQAIAVTVTPVNDNTPVITSAATANVAENSTAVTTVTATDADLPAQVLTYSIVGGADAARFSIVAGTGVLSFNAAPDFEAPLDVGADNVYDVTVQVDDNAGRTTTQAIAVTVTPVNDNTPVITSAATANVAENSTAVTTVTATDADLPAQVLTYSIVGGADAARFSIVAGTGVLSFNAAPDFEAPLDVGADNVYDVTVQVDDNAGRTTTQAIAVTVTPVNDNDPRLINNAWTIVDGGTLSVTPTNVSATDSDTPVGTLVFSVVSVTNGYFELVVSPGAPVTTFTQQQIANGEVRFVHDGSGAPPTFTLYVSDGASNVGPAAANITFIGAGIGTPAPAPGGGGGGGGTPVTPPTQPPVTTTVSTGMSPTTLVTFFRPGGGGSGADGGEVNFIEVRPVPASLTVTDRVATPEGLLIPPVRMQGDVIETSTMRAEIEPIRAEMQVIPTRHELDLSEDERQRIEVVLNSVRITGLALSVGAVWWAARAAGLVASLLASSPAWRHVDPLPVLGRDEEEEEEWDESVEDQDKKDEEHRAAWVLEGESR